MTALTRIPDVLLDAIDARFGARWRIASDGGRLAVTHPRPLARPGVPRRALSPGMTLARIESALLRHGIVRAHQLPMRWRRDTDLVISAIQALDPWLKDGASRVWREGYLPQPVVRFTGERDGSGRLKDGFLTSFVNVSCVQRIRSVQQHVELIDAWIHVLSTLGVHASRLSLHGDASVWRRGAVEGITLFIYCDEAAIGDTVLLWHADDPARMASDLGSGLERLRWVVSGQSWQRLIHSELASHADIEMLDAVRTATLLLMSGIRPAARGAGAAVRRVARCVSRRHAAIGLSRAVRFHHAYWTEVGVRGLGWPHVAALLEQVVLDHANQSRDYA